MSKFLFSQREKPVSTFANTLSKEAGNGSPSKLSESDAILNHDFQSTFQDQPGLPADLRINMEKCSNSADLPSTQNHKAAAGFGDV